MNSSFETVSFLPFATNGIVKGQLKSLFSKIHISQVVNVLQQENASVCPLLPFSLQHLDHLGIPKVPDRHFFMFILFKSNCIDIRSVCQNGERPSTRIRTS